MTTTPRSARLVSGVAAVAVACVALGAVADAWFDRRLGAASSATQQAARPAADAPVEVVRVPAQDGVRRLPTACRSCDAGRMPGSRL